MTTDAGSGLLGTGLGILVVGAFLLLTVDTCMLLLARSTVAGAATDAATVIARGAGADGVLDADELGAATTLAGAKVAAIAGSDATMAPPQIDPGSGTVTITVRRAVPRTLPLPGRTTSSVARSAVVRLEVLR